MATCAATGDLLQPSYPLTPIERMIIQGGGMGDCTGPNHRAYTYGCGTNLLATYTAVQLTTPTGPTSRLWWTAMGFVDGRGQLQTSATIFEADLAPMSDLTREEYYPAASFGSIPTGSFSGDGTKFNHSEGHVVWEGAFVHQVSGDCSHVEVRQWTGSVNLTMPNGPRGRDDGAAIAYLAPVFGKVALLGEAGKVAAMSTYRFSSVVVSSDGAITTHLRGKPGEDVKLLFARLSGQQWECVPMPTEIGPDGTATATLPSSID